MVKSTLTLICGAGVFIGRNLVNRPKNDGSGFAGWTRNLRTLGQKHSDSTADVFYLVRSSHASIGYGQNYKIDGFREIAGWCLFKAQSTPLRLFFSKNKKASFNAHIR
jgi:hypothetical protein